MRILCLGAGDVGSQLAKTLTDSGHDLTVVDENPEKLQALENQSDLRTLCGNVASLAILEAAGMAQTDLALCVTAHDEVNMISCLLARGMGVANVIVRVKNPEYLAGRRYFYRKVLDCDFLFSPEELASEEICKVIQEHHSIAVENFADGRVQMRKIRLEAKSKLEGKKLRELNLPPLSLIVAVFRF